MPFGRQNHCSEADLSAYLDAQLPDAAKQRCDAHLTACGDCREALDGLSAVRSSLRQLPQAAAPRSFRLREAQVEVIRSRQPAFIVRVMPQLSGISVVSLVAFLALVGINASGGVGVGDGDSDSSGASLTRSLQEDAAASNSPPDSDTLEASEASPDATSEPLPQGATRNGTNDAFSGDDALSAEATRTAAAQFAPDPVSEGEDGDGTASSASNVSDDSNTGLYIAMALTAALALASGSLAFAAWRRTA